MEQKLPSVPLITCDPYFSIWSPANRLTEAPTVCWTNAVKQMTGTAVIDGKSRRWMGTGDEPALEQTDCSISPTASRYLFAGDGVRLTVTFLTPLLLSDLDLTSRPVSYIALEAESADGASHAVTANITLDEGFCYDGEQRKPVLGGVHACGGFRAAWMGQKRQAPLSHSDDGITIDWGYLYLAARGGTVEYREGERNVLTSSFPLELSGEGSSRALAAVAYDDVASIQYFGDICRGYWARGGKTILEAIGEALKEYDTLSSRCGVFDEALTARAEAAGGESYARLCSAAYRQSIAAHKMIVDRDGSVVFLSKECYSNGCAATVDVSYPSVPLYLLFRPELVKGMLRPIFRYARMPVWEYDFAPHDAGRYPYVWGQVYALKDRVGAGEVYPPNYLFPAGSDIFEFRNQMPVEECGNMLIMTAAVVLCDEDTGWIDLSLLEHWVGYLIRYGSDPGDQLCTDDFAGHLAHNINLAAKAIMGIEAYSMILSRSGRKPEAEQYHRKAAAMARDWEKRAACGDHTALCFGDADTWSLKYNLIWDRLFGSRLFSETLYQREIKTYLEHGNEFGVPLDSRRDYTKTDWMMWAASFSDDPGVVERFAAPLAAFLSKAPRRTPFSDWIDTKTAEQQGFQNRTVQGGIFMPLLKQEWVK